ncbi:hypothetical protein EDF72_2597 [Delftia acidovorans]|uniref:hypothetical protein n=1 Tax=Delftia acidovorans TaxID=80866 RepID=UPI000FC0F293|nr:hypothetical protein [Delftia acidovorans]ROR01063.1 hypothetical protein EDF72_2597 [Delftia acidovorans]
MEVFDKVVIEGSGTASRLYAIDTELDKKIQLDEEKVVTAFHSAPTNVKIESGPVELTSRKIYENDAKAKAVSDEILEMATTVNRARRSIQR